MTTLQDIALKAGVSVGMVSRTLNNRVKGAWPRSAEQVARIRRIADRMMYRPHAGARAARTRSFQNIGLVVVRPYATAEVRLHSFNAALVEGIHAVVLERNFCISFVCVDFLPSPRPEHWPRLLAESRVDGLILTDFAPAELQTQIRKMAIPAVWLNTNRGTRTDCVTFDDAGAAHDLTARLLALGHRRIAYASPASDLHYSARERRDGFELALREHDLSPCPGLNRNVTDSDFEDAAERVINAPDRPTAVVAYSVGRSSQIERVARRMGLCVPRDLSLVTWFDSAEQQQWLPTLYAGMNVNMWDAGRAAATMLFERIAARKPCRSIVRKEEFLSGESLAPPAATEGNGAAHPHGRAPLVPAR